MKLEKLIEQAKTKQHNQEWLHAAHLYEQATHRRPENIMLKLRNIQCRLNTDEALNSIQSELNLIVEHHTLKPNQYGLLISLLFKTHQTERILEILDRNVLSYYLSHKTRASIAMNNSEWSDAIKSYEHIRDHYQQKLTLQEKIKLLSCYVKIDDRLHVQQYVHSLMTETDLSDHQKYKIGINLINHDYIVEAETTILTIDGDLIQECLKAKILLRQEQYDDCLLLVEEIKKNDLSHYLLSDLARCELTSLAQQERWSECIEAGESLTKPLPNFSFIYSILLKALKQTRNESRYHELITKAFHKFGFSQTGITKSYVNHLELQGEREQALQLLEEGYKVNPGLLSALIKQYLKKGHWGSFIKLMSDGNLRDEQKMQHFHSLLTAHMRIGNFSSIPAMITQILNIQAKNQKDLLLKSKIQIELSKLYSILTSPDLDLTLVLSPEDQIKLIELLESSNFDTDPESILTELLEQIDTGKIWPEGQIRRYLSFLKSHNQHQTIHSYENPSGALYLAQFIKSRIKQKIPSSFIRLGDGEGNFLDYPDEFIDRQQSDQEVIQYLWWKELVLTKSNADITDQFRKAVINADILGIIPERRIIRSTASNNIVTHSKRGLLAVMNTVLIADHDCTLYTSCHAHTDLEQWDLYSYILRDLDTISVISCHSDIDEYITQRFGIEEVTLYRIPSERKYQGLFGYDDSAEAHFPNYFVRLSDELRSIERGQTFLVAAGFLGKIYCDIIRQHGGIALDIGSIADRWVGYATRSIDALGILMGGLWFNHEERLGLNTPIDFYVKSNYNYDRQLKITEQDHKDPIDCKFLVTGHPRTGTYYTSRLFKKYGFGIGHERLAVDGMSSWLHAVTDLKTREMGRLTKKSDLPSRYHLEVNHLLLQVRHPQDAIPSIIVENRGNLSYRYRRFHIYNELGIDIHDGVNYVERAALSYINWIKIIEAQDPDAILKLEHIEEDLQRFYKNNDIDPIINQDYDIKEDKNSTITMTGMPKPVLSPQDYNSLSTGIRDDLLGFCERYHYSTDFLGI